MNKLKYRNEHNINVGPLMELPIVAVDYFAERSNNSTLFFLSHGHSDHMTGLELKTVRDRIENDVVLYCNPLTPLLMGSFDYLGKDWIYEMSAKKRIVGLDMCTKHRIETPGQTIGLSVTLLPAGHCPGSVMFLFEWGENRVVHTGDCRVGAVDLKKLTLLHDDQGKILPITKLYLDTTFAFPLASDFPNRLDVIDEGLAILDDWIRQSPENIVNFDFPAHFCHEAIFLRVAKFTKCKIHVSGSKAELCQSITSLANCTTVEYGTRIHACKLNNCWSLRDLTKVLTVKLTSTWWTKNNNEYASFVTFRGKFLHICYSMHASLSELHEMINYLRPRSVTPLVLPKNGTRDGIENSLRLNVSYPFRFECGEIEELSQPGTSSSPPVEQLNSKKRDSEGNPLEWSYSNGTVWQTTPDPNASISSDNLSDFSDMSDEDSPML